MWLQSPIALETYAVNNIFKDYTQGPRLDI